MRHKWAFPLLLLAFAIQPSVFAHPGHEVSGLSSGFGHPFSGLDHMLAMLAVGIWAAQNGGRAFWLFPAVFMGVMTFGGILGVEGVNLPLVESGILASVLVLGLLIAAARKLPLWTGALLVAAFALFHGHAHGAELGQNTSAFAFSLGLLGATGILHALGVAGGFLCSSQIAPKLVRVAGGIVAASAVPIGLGGI